VWCSQLYTRAGSHRRTQGLLNTELPAALQRCVGAQQVAANKANAPGVVVGAAVVVARGVEVGAEVGAAVVVARGVVVGAAVVVMRGVEVGAAVVVGRGVVVMAAPPPELMSVYGACMPHECCMYELARVPPACTESVSSDVICTRGRGRPCGRGGRCSRGCPRRRGGRRCRGGPRRRRGRRSGGGARRCCHSCAQKSGCHWCAYECLVLAATCSHASACTEKCQQLIAPGVVVGCAVEVARGVVVGAATVVARGVVVTAARRSKACCR
jgi:NDP-sugar pyrophosphorylase family protein